MKRLDKFAQFAIVSAKLAVEDANLDLDKTDRERVGVIIGSGIGGVEAIETQHKILWKKEIKSKFTFVPMMIGNMAAGQVSIFLEQKGLILMYVQLVHQELIQ